MSTHNSLADTVLMSQEVPPQSSSSAVNGAGVDMKGWDGVLFAITVGAIASTGTFNAKAQRDDVSNFASPTDISGAAVTALDDTGDNQLLIIDVFRPSERYVRCVVTPATAASLVGVVAIRYRRTGNLPPTQVAGQLVRVVEN